MQNLVGQRIDRLIVVEKIGYKIYEHGRLQNYLCKCDCGNYCERTIKNLHSTRYHSCGCYKIEKAIETGKKPTNAKKTHGMSNSRLYSIYRAMKRRCTNPKDRAYKNYGGRGITICEEWNKFEPFMEWAFQSGYREDLTIDRIDNNMNYSPQNCRWASRKEQMENTRRTRKYTYGGETHCLKYWATKFEIPRSTLFYRLEKGMTFDEAIQFGRRVADVYIKEE